MKLSDLFEGFPRGKIRRSIKDTLPIIGVIPEIDNGNLYLNYRFGTTLASALAVANGEHPYNKQIPWHTQQTVAPYTQQELDIVKLACQQSGFTLDMLHDETSHEPDWVNTVSPVANLPMLESRRLLEAFGSQKLSKNIEATLPPVIVIPELNSGNNYPQYRFMTVMASVRAVKNGDVPYRKLQPWASSLAVVGYTPEDIETIKMAAAEAGFAIDEINDSPSHEPDWVNTKSPVMKFNMLEAVGDDTFKQPKTPLIHNLSPADDKAISYQDTPTRGKPQIVVVYPGRFQPLHRGHKAVYDELVKEFGPNVYIATSNKTDPDKSPFDFEDKLRMARAAGIPADKIQLVKNPYDAAEIKERFVPGNTVLLFAVGEKDMETDPRFKFDEKGQAYKKDGSLAYLQKWPGMHKASTMDKHAYIIAAPTKEFAVLGKPATSATEIRKAYRSADPSKRDQIITDLYGKPKVDIRSMFDDKLGQAVSEDQETYLQNPLDPEGDTNGPGKTGDAFDGNWPGHSDEDVNEGLTAQDITIDPQPAMDRKELIQLLHKWKGTLDSRVENMLDSWADGQSINAIAKEHGVSTTRVNHLLQRGLFAIRDRMNLQTGTDTGNLYGLTKKYQRPNYPMNGTYKYPHAMRKLISDNPHLKAVEVNVRGNRRYLAVPLSDPRPSVDINEHIVKHGSGYRLLSKKTGKNLGTFKTRAAAEKHEREIQYFKHAKESR